MLPAEVQRAILERAGGNPLYAEEFVRLLKDRGLLLRRSRGCGGSTPTRRSRCRRACKALIAARVDTLSQEQKALIQDAAVVGKVFWSGAVAEIGGRDVANVERELHDLSRPASWSASSVGHRSRASASTRFGTRSSATSRTARSRELPAPRSMWWSRAGSRRLAGERADDQAELLAAHYEPSPRATHVQRRAWTSRTSRRQQGRAFTMAGERTHELDVAKAESYHRRALELLPLGESRARRRVWSTACRGRSRRSQRIATRTSSWRRRP